MNNLPPIIMDSMMTVTKAFNPNGSSEAEFEKIVGGDHTGILILTDVKYKWVMQLLDYNRKNTWFPHTIDFTKDRLQYKNDLTQEEFEAFNDILSFLIYLDSIQTVQPALYSQYISSPAVSALLTYQAYQEMIHSWSYSYNLESIESGLDKRKIFERWKDNPLLMKRNKFLGDIYDDFRLRPNHETMAKSMTANYLLESVFFYNGFKFFYSLEARGLMGGTASNIRYINRDEYGHQIMYKNMINTLNAEGEMTIREDETISMFEEGTNQEIEFSSQLLSNVLGFNEKVINDYTKYRSNKALADIGFTKNPYSEFTKNPFNKWDAEFEDTLSRETNVFSGKNINYIVGGMSGFDKF